MSDQTNLREPYTLLERLAPGGAEDFITEAFCWILQQEDVGNAFLEFLIERDQAQDQATRRGAITDIVSGIRKGVYRWSTQKSLRISSGVKRLDMICKFEKQALIFEHKAWTPLDADQLKNYRQVGKEYYNSGFAIILITARHYQKEQNPDLHFLWRDVYSWLDKWLDCWLSKRLPKNAPGTDADKANLEFVCRNFLTLLKKRGLGPMLPIENKHFKAFKTKPDADEGMRRLEELLGAVKYRWSERALKPDSKMLYPSKDLQKKWGRIGFQVLKDKTWHPGIFIGVLHDGKDHKVKLLGDKNSPDACVIFDIEKNKYPDYRKNRHYVALVKRLTEKWPTDGAATWRCMESYRNEWHPLHIRRDLEDVLLDGKSGDDQVKAFIQEVKEVLKFIEGLEEFWKFREDLKLQKSAKGK